MKSSFRKIGIFVVLILASVSASPAGLGSRITRGAGSLGRDLASGAAFGIGTGTGIALIDRLFGWGSSRNQDKDEDAKNSTENTVSQDDRAPCDLEADDIARLLESCGETCEFDFKSCKLLRN